MHAVTTAVFYRIGNVQLYARNRNQLNLIIIPVSIGSVCFLFILTFCLRQMRYVKDFNDHYLQYACILIQS